MTRTNKTLRPHKSTSGKMKTGLMLVFSVLLLAAGIAMFPKEALKGAFIIAFFGLCTIVFLIQLLPGSSWLSLDEEGFTYCTLFRKRRVRWQDVESIEVVRIGGNSMVGWSYVEGYEGSITGRKLGRALAGVGAALPETYDRSASELAELMRPYLSQSR